MEWASMNDAAWTGCGLATWGVVRIAWDDIPHWRKHPGPAEGLHTAALKLADEQTVLALAAVLQAIQRAGWAPTSFPAWGVLAAPHYVARFRCDQAINRFQKLGVRGISPLVIPSLSQHSVASGVGMILGCHGATFGIGGGSTPFVEMVLNALSIMDAQACPGVWALLTGWEPDCIPDGNGQVVQPTMGLGVALALTPQAAGGAIRLCGPGAGTGPRPLPGSVSLRGLADFLTQSGPEPCWRCPISGGGSLEVIPSPAGLSSLPLRRAS
jgi:hypothetical protein